MINANDAIAVSITTAVGNANKHITAYSKQTNKPIKYFFIYSNLIYSYPRTII